MRFPGFVLMLLLALAGASAQACPPELSRAQLRKLDAQDVKVYAMTRWLKCGWDEAAGAMKFWRKSARTQAREQRKDDTDSREFIYDEFVEEVMVLAQLNPAGRLDAVKDLDMEPDADDPAELAQLLQLRVDGDTRLRNIDERLPQVVALLREAVSPDAEQDVYLELILVKWEVRQGRIAEAISRLERLQKTNARRLDEADSYTRVVEDRSKAELEELAKALTPVAPLSAAPSGPGWHLDRTEASRPQCGTPFINERNYGVSYLREYVLRSADAQAATTELLDTQWRYEFYDGAPQRRLLMELLRNRYSETQLRQGWADALASVRADDDVVGLYLFGQFLPLPSHVIEDVPGSLYGGPPRRLSVTELVELVQATQLYRLLNPAPAGATAAASG